MVDWTGRTLNHVQRRALIAGAMGLGVTALLSACAPSVTHATAVAPKASLGPLPESFPPPQAIPFDPRRIVTQPRPAGPLYSLDSPGTGLIAWTVDDGFNEAVTKSYAEFTRDSGMRMTFFVCAEAPGWTTAQPILQPLIESGQVQIGNHTRTHADLLTQSEAQIQDTLMTNNELIMNLYGVDPRPYFRPPFGRYDERVVRAAAAVGYTLPVLWNGTLSDSGEIPPETLMTFADRYMSDGTILLGHANAWPVTVLYPRLTKILESRNLMSVTLNDIYQA